jgi:hypothetical protein
MALDVVPLRQNIPIPGAQFLSAVSENLIQALAGENNFINYFQYEVKAFFLNGPYYNASPIPQQATDGLAIFEFNSQIIDVWMFNNVAGTSGATELDLLISTTSGGAFTSIFNVQPQITYQAPNYTWVGAPNPTLIGNQYNPPTYIVPSYTVQPVLNSSITNFIPAQSAIRCDLLSVMQGAENCGILIHWRPI